MHDPARELPIMIKALGPFLMPQKICLDLWQSLSKTLKVCNWSNCKSGFMNVYKCSVGKTTLVTIVY